MSEVLKKVTIVITQELIVQCPTQDSWRCPMAVAFNEVIKPEYCFAVGIMQGQFYRKEPLEALPYVFNNTEPMQHWMKHFDTWGGKQSKPATFEVELHEELLR